MFLTPLSLSDDKEIQNPQFFLLFLKKIITFFPVKVLFFFLHPTVTSHYHLS